MGRSMHVFYIRSIRWSNILALHIVAGYYRKRKKYVCSIFFSLNAIEDKKRFEEKEYIKMC
jgi:hypothetical protein